MALAASNDTNHSTHYYLNWQDAPITYWEVLKEKDRNGDCECNAEGRGYVAKLLPEGIAERFASVPGVEVERHKTNEDRSNEHPVDINKDTNADGHKADNFLYYLKIEEDIATTQNLKHVEIDGMQWVESHGDADERKIGSCLVPLRSYKAVDEWFSHCTEGNHADGGHEHRHLNDSSIAFHHPLLIVLYLAQHWIAHPLDNACEVGREDACILITSGILSEGGGTIELAYNHLIELNPDVVEQSADKEFPSEAPHISKRLSGELELWPPFVEHPKTKGIE